MATTFTFGVSAPGSVASGGTNLFPRFTNDGAINLDGRVGISNVADNYTLNIAVIPAQIEPGTAAQLNITIRRDNQEPGNTSIVYLNSSDETVIPVGTSLITGTNGIALISLIGGVVGQATISAYFEINSRTIPSNAVVVTVAQIEGPEDYNATGDGQLELTIESSLVKALKPRVQWLSHAEQKQKYQDDTGLRMLLWYENSGEIIFIPKSMQQ